MKKRGTRQAQCVRMQPRKQQMTALRSQFVTQMQMRKYVYKTADDEHCFDLSGLISAVGGLTTALMRPDRSKQCSLSAVLHISLRICLCVTNWICCCHSLKLTACVQKALFPNFLLRGFSDALWGAFLPKKFAIN